MIHRKNNFRGTIPRVSNINHKEDFVPTTYKCFHCGKSTSLNSGLITDHNGVSGKCWASGRPNPPAAPPKDPKFIRKKLQRESRKRP